MKPNGHGTYGAMLRAHKEGRKDLNGNAVDFRGQLAIMEAHANGVQDTDELRRIALKARKHS